MNVKICKTCGAENDVTAGYCCECGRREFISEYENIAQSAPLYATVAQSAPLEPYGGGFMDYVVRKSNAEKKADETLEKLYDFCLLDDGTYMIRSIDKSQCPRRLDIPDTYRKRPVTCIGNSAFRFCMSLREVNIPDSITKIEDGIFYGCESVIELNIPHSVEKIEGNPFSNLSLSKIKIDSRNKVYAKRSGCIIEKATGTLIACDEESVIPDDIKVISSTAFGVCTDCKKMEISTSVKKIERNPFAKLPLENITVHPDHRIYRKENGCIIDNKTSTVIAGDENSTIPDGITAIGTSAFRSRIYLESITLPESITFISGLAFAFCVKLDTIIYKGTKKEWENIDKILTWRVGTRILTVHCTDGKIVLD